ncbi:protein sgm1-like isoform X1 [Schistocerca americana]|uniref:protein sgm1-like isoform X1 n=1 Tax=Schistocerca americana TaxID=7009 RepID=UPI001F4F9D89|nr:protein sgm1-like isoform X1 [Schistocerca americana]XP_047116890.1 protein sgm1-like isoform X1 [Schistocerca piceifrons]XP_049962652.1 uncharacterized protein LOC126483640 isoform X1 [Schistocerca serialis cubense]
MGIDNMRGGYGRCPPLLAGGLFVMCVILVFNWWSLSSQNYELLKQLQDLSEQLKISSDEQDLCIRQKQGLETRNKLTEDDLAKSRVRIELIEKENDELKKTVETKEEELRTSQKAKEEAQGNADRCNTELDSLKKLDISKDGTMASLRLDKNRVTKELETLQQQVKKLRTQLDNAQSELANMKNGKQNVSPAIRAPSAVQLRVGELPLVTPVSAVDVHSTGLKGMIYHRGVPILPQDPPDAYRPPPRFSVTQLKVSKEQSVTLPDNNIVIGGDHELEVEENNNNAKEERDEGDAQADLNAETNQVLEPEQRMEVEEEEAAPA